MYNRVSWSGNNAREDSISRDLWHEPEAMLSGGSAPQLWRPASSASERSSIVGSSLTTRSRQRTGLQIYLSLAVLDTREVKGRRKRSLLLFTLCPHSALARYSPSHGACRTVCKAYSQVVIGDGLSVVHSLSLLFSHTILPKSARLSADMSSREKKPCHEGTAQQRVHALSLAAQVTSLNTCT